MNARDELFEIVNRDPISSGGDDPIWTNDLLDAHRDEEFEALYNEMSRLVGVGPYSMGIMSVLNQAIDNIKEYRDE